MTTQHAYRDELVALLEVNNELSRIESFDQLCMRAVELATNRLGFDRVGIWFRGDTPDSVVGSFGVDENGKIRDERKSRINFPVPRMKRQIQLLKPPGFIIRQNDSLRDGRGRVVGRGTWACAVLWSGDAIIGHIFVDNLLTHRPVNVELLAFFASTFGHLCNLKKTQEALKRSEERHRELWDNAPVAYHTLDRQGNITSVNKTEAAMLGYKPREMLGRPIFDFIIPEQRAEAKRRFQKKIVGRRPPKAGNRIYLKKDGTPMIVAIEDKLELDSSGKPVGVWTTMVDVTDQKETEETIKRLAYSDVLTGLPNRLLFNERLTLALVRARRKKQKFSVMLMDVDYFKRINDSLGHAAGDRLLKQIGDRLTGLLRKSDIVSRMGGDEFLVLLPQLDRALDAQNIADKILAAVSVPFSLDGRDLNVTVSIGLTIYPADGQDAETLLKNADIAMYAAKKAGRNNRQRFTAGKRA